MKILKIVFSPTGGCEKAADLLIQGLAEKGDVVESLDLSAQEIVISKELQADLAVLAVPSFGGRVPALAAERIRGLKGNGIKAVMMAVYGNRAYDDTLLELSDTAAAAGFKPFAGVSAVAEHSILHQFAANRPDEKDAAELKKAAERIRMKMQKGEDGEPALPGKRPYVKAGAGLVPKAGKDCNGCGICAQRCPAMAISKTNPKETDAKKCISCMRCTVICPKMARSVNPVMKKIAGAAIGKACKVRKECELFL